MKYLAFSCIMKYMIKAVYIVKEWWKVLHKVSQIMWVSQWASPIE